MDDTGQSALREALDVIDSINGCHGCLDNGDERDRETVARLRGLADLPLNPPLGLEDDVAGEGATA